MVVAHGIIIIVGATLAVARKRTKSENNRNEVKSWKKTSINLLKK